jgi:hypothetical protein
MNINSNEKVIKRNTTIAKYSMLISFALLVGLMIFLFTNQSAAFSSYSLLAIIGAFMLSQVAAYFQNRWGRSPRPDEVLNSALKGLDSSYNLYHYQKPVSHLLVGPAGIWVLLPHYQRGNISFEKGRYRQKGGGFILNYMKIFGQEGLGRPEIEAKGAVEDTAKYLQKLLPEEEIPEVKPILIFTDPRANLVDVKEAPVPAMEPKELKEFIRKQAKSRPMSMTKVKKIQDAIEVIG